MVEKRQSVRLGWNRVFLWCQAPNSTIPHNVHVGWNGVFFWCLTPLKDTIITALL